jgi:hypothetical protein
MARRQGRLLRRTANEHGAAGESDRGQHRNRVFAHEDIALDVMLCFSNFKQHDGLKAIVCAGKSRHRLK